MKRRGAFYTLVPYVMHKGTRRLWSGRHREREIYLQKNVLICDIGINKMYVGFVIWVF